MISVTILAKDINHNIHKINEHVFTFLMNITQVR